jgi:hypothetical protein
MESGSFWATAELGDLGGKHGSVSLRLRDRAVVIGLGYSTVQPGM